MRLFGKSFGAENVNNVSSYFSLFLSDVLMLMSLCIIVIICCTGSTLIVRCPEVHAGLIMMGRDLHLRTTAITGLLFIPRVICGHGEPWWWCQLGITPEWTNKWEFCPSVSEIPQGIFNMPQNLTTWDLWLYFPSEGRCAADFYRP
jgi:hypothetical protein